MEPIHLLVADKDWTTSDLFKLVPQNWRNAPIYISNSIGSCVKINRISLHTNKDGAKVVLLHERQIEKP